MGERDQKKLKGAKGVAETSSARVSIDVRYVFKFLVLSSVELSATGVD